MWGRLRRSKLPELVIPIEQTGQGVFVARGPDGCIVAQADSFADLKLDVVRMISSRIPKGSGPITIRFQLGKVRTSSLIGYLATIFAWELEIGVILIHLCSQRKITLGAHALLLAATLSLTTFAWYRRKDFHNLRGVIRGMPLTRSQMLAVVVFVLALSVGVVAICAVVFGA
jgi:hypothetical protein